ncbi:MAG: hypothetical protein ACREJM_11070 [Candidatus Saccharimonadales bacterium]
MTDTHQLPAAFDAYEVHGVRAYGRGVNRYCEQVPDDQAQFFSLFGHIPGQGLECIGDFKSRALAEEVAARITRRYSALQETLAWLATAAEDLDASIDGATSEFDLERTELAAACRHARDGLATGAPLDVHQRRAARKKIAVTHNARRAMRVEHVLTWCKDWGSHQEGLIDLLTDARHWCDRHGQRFADLDRLASQHYADERNHKED